MGFIFAERIQQIKIIIKLQGNRYKLSYDGMYHLDIPKTRQYDHGKVEVVARSSLGEARCETTLTVKPRSDDYRGVLKNSPRREYLSPWGRGRWNTENLVDPPQFFKFNSKNKLSNVRIKELEEKGVKLDRYYAGLYFNADNLSRNKSSVERRSHLTWEHLNEYAYKFKKPIQQHSSTSFKSVKNYKIQKTLSIRHIHCIRQEKSITSLSTSYLNSHPNPSYHTTPCKIQKPVVVPAASSPSEASSTSLVNEFPGCKGNIKLIENNNVLRFTHTARNELLQVMSTTKIVR